MPAEPLRSNVLDPDSADLALLQDRQVAVLGFGTITSAHALNLRDSGVDVRVGVPADSRAAARAEIEGLAVTEPQLAIAQADIVTVAPGDDVDDLQRLLEEGLEPGDMVVLTAPTGQDAAPVVPEGVDLVTLSALGPDHRLRSEYTDGRGAPALVGVTIDATGVAWPVLTAYAASLGSLRSGALVIDPDQVARATDFADLALHDTVQRLTEEVFDVLTESGVPGEVAYLACVQQLHERVSRVASAGWSAQYGPAATAGETSTVLDAGVAGRLRELWQRGSSVSTSATAADAQAPTRRGAAQRAHPIETFGRAVRGLMSWVR